MLIEINETIKIKTRIQEHDSDNEWNHNDKNKKSNPWNLKKKAKDTITMIEIHGTKKGKPRT